MTPEGLLPIDKPLGLTSHDVIAQLRRLSGMRRFGHAGTLDPLATGVLLVGVGRATRLLEYLSDQPKHYEAAVRLGERTDTFDAEGQIVEQKQVEVTAAEIEQALNHFRGPITQFAPAYSAIKRDGQPLYKLARKGQEVERPARQVTIYHLVLRSWQRPIVHLAVSCSAGTYIRSLADDLGCELGCGGHLSALRRTAVGAFTVTECVPLGELDEQNWSRFLLPMDFAVRHLPEVLFDRQGAHDLLQGRRVGATTAWPEGTLARAYGDDGCFLGVVVVAAGVWQSRKMFPAQ